MSSELPLKILCIHGYRQNGQVFRERTGAFRKIIKKHAELVFITAPHRVPPLETEDESANSCDNSDSRGWWFSRPDDYYNPIDYTDCSKGDEESIQHIIQVFKEEGPFDGILAFSQGAAFLSILCSIQQKDPESPIRFGFAIFVAGFKSRQNDHQKYYDVIIDIPTLHVIGEADKVIPKDLILTTGKTERKSHIGSHFTMYNKGTVMERSGLPKAEFRFKSEENQVHNVYQPGIKKDHWTE